jgi:polysaccharide chain length determinant protein (PEP-CTERM system associated)
LADLFLQESMTSRANESQNAFDFIDQQAKQYHEKLMNAEQALKDFRSKHIDARPGTETDVAKRIDALQATLDRTALEVKEAKIREASLKKQLSGEAEVAVNLTRESQYVARIAELQSQMENLRLTYHETYPDIVRIKHQIEDLKEAVAAARREREEARKLAKANSDTVVDESVRINPIYQQLKQQLFDTRTNIDMLNARHDETRVRLKEEMERATRVHGGEATLAELTRDYEVNREIYQDLLRRRENARVSRNLGREQQDFTLRVQEPAVAPRRAGGVGFLHIMIGGMVLSVLLPGAAIFALVQFDPRIRIGTVIADRLKLPLLGVVPHYWAPAEVATLRREVGVLSRAAGATVALMLGIGVLRVVGVL